jgi:hypothetical protein
LAEAINFVAGDMSNTKQYDSCKCSTISNLIISDNFFKNDTIFDRNKQKNYDEFIKFN